MSELQLGLLGIGIVVLVAVIAYNKWQEAKLKRRTESAFAPAREDALLGRRGGAAADAAGAEAPTATPRVEHTLGEDDPGASFEPPATATLAPAPAEPPPAAVLDGALDYIVDLECPRPALGADVARHARDLVDEAMVKPVHWEGQPRGEERWGQILADGRYDRLRVGLQLANRAGAVRTDDLAAFCASIQELALALGAIADLPDVDEALERATALDRFCGEVDVQIGLSVIGSESHTFPGSKIRAVAESAGLAIGRDGRFHRHAEDGTELFALSNMEPMPFHAETLRTLQTRGVTALFDVPRVPASGMAFRRFIDFAHQLEQALGGVLVDDNRRPIGQAALEAISQQLASIHRRMEEQGIPAGSPAAMRLFS